MAKYPKNMTDGYVVLGLSKGTVVFLQVDDLELIYARFSFHRQAVTKVMEIQSTGKFLSICEELNMCLWGFEDESY